MTPKRWDRGVIPGYSLKAALFAATFPAVLFLFFVPYYAVNDNTFLAMILRGVGFVDGPSAWTLHLNILLGKTLQVLYREAPRVAWYPLFLTGVLSLSLWVFTAHGLPLADRPVKRVLLFLLLSAVFYRFLLFLDWTSTSLLASMAGVFGIAVTLSDRKARWIGIAGILLVGSSALIRGETTLPGILAAAPLLLQGWGGQPAGQRRIPRTGWVLLLIVLALPLAVNETALTAHPEWRDALRYAKMRERFVEFKAVPYDARTAPVFEKAGWDRLDHELFGTWYAGIGKFDLARLGFLDKSLKGHSPRPWFRIREFFQQPSFAYFLLLLLLLLVWLSPRNRAFILALLGWELLLMVFLLLFFKLPERVAAPFLAFPVLAGLHAALSDRNLWGRGEGGRVMRMLALLGMGAVLAHSLWFSWAMDRVFRDREAGFKRAVVDLPRGPERLLVFWGNGIHVDWIRAFDDYQTLEGLNLYPVFWLQTSPHAEAMRKRFGLEDPVRDLVDRSDILLAPSDLLPWPLFKRYQMEKYGRKVAAVGVLDGMGCRVYRIVSRGKVRGGFSRVSPGGPPVVSSRDSGTTR